MERAAGQAHADAVLANDRLRAQGATLVLVGTLPGLPHHAGGRPADPRSPPMVRAHRSYPGALVPIMPAACAVCRTRPALLQKCR
jgi:hypothetical protein